MSTGVRNENNPSTTWFWRDWQMDTAKLTKAEKGMWIDVIGECSEAPMLGDWTGPLSVLMGYGETLETCWKMLQGLGSKKIADVEVMIGGVMVPVVSETFAQWGEFKPTEMTPARVVCRRLVKQRERNEKNAERMRERRGTEHRTRTDATQNEHRTNTDATQNAHRRNTETVTTRARASSISSTIVEDSSAGAHEGENKKATTMVDAAFVDEMVGVYGPLGVDVRTEAVLAEQWVAAKGRKFTKRFFRDTWLKNEARDKANRKRSPKEALQAARDAGEFTGERLCPDFDGTIE
jgi:hypothetical protein